MYLLNKIKESILSLKENISSVQKYILLRTKIFERVKACVIYKYKIYKFP